MTPIGQMSAAEFLVWMRGFIHGLDGKRPTASQWETIRQHAFVQTEQADALAEFTED
jgi:hypothetical protein